MRSASDAADQALEALYDRIAGDEDARVCLDIPQAACADQPRNFFAYLGANLLGKVADELASARLTLPWLFGTLGVPTVLTGMLVPIREAGVLLPQLAVAAAVRRMAVRKGVWLLGAAVSALCLFAMAATALSTRGALAGGALLLLLVLYSLARGLCSVSAKDVLGKTVSKTRRGRLMGWSTSLSGIAMLGVGLWLGAAPPADGGLALFAGLFAAAGALWLLAALAFAAIREQPGATEGGGNALSVGLEHLALLSTDRPLRRFLIARALLLAVALAPPFYVLLAQQHSAAGLLGLGALIVANGLAAGLSAPIWGYLGDRSSRWVMSAAAGGAGLLAILTYAAVRLDWLWITGELGWALLFLAVSVLHGGVRLGRKVYLVDMADAGNRAAYVALSNTLIGVLMLAAGSIGLIGSWFGAESAVLALGLLSLAAAAYVGGLPEVGGAA